MTASTVFQIVNTVVLPAWLILIFLPKKSWRNPAIYGFAMLMAVGNVFYVVIGLDELDSEAFY
jgi:hypothetical protein